MLLCLISSLLSTQRFSKSGPHSACSSHIGWLIKCVSAGSLRIPAPAEFLKGLALESVLLKTRCSASVNDKYILLLAIFLVKNNLFLQLFWLLGFKKKITTAWHCSREREGLNKGYRSGCKSWGCWSREVASFCFAEGGLKPSKRAFVTWQIKKTEFLERLIESHLLVIEQGEKRGKSKWRGSHDWFLMKWLIRLAFRCVCVCGEAAAGDSFWSPSAWLETHRNSRWRQLSDLPLARSLALWSAPHSTFPAGEQWRRSLCPQGRPGRPWSFSSLRNLTEMTSGKAAKQFWLHFIVCASLLGSSSIPWEDQICFPASPYYRGLLHGALISSDYILCHSFPRLPSKLLWTHSVRALVLNESALGSNNL